MKLSIVDTLSAPAWARPSARLARPISLCFVLRVIAFALIAAFASGLASVHADSASDGFKPKPQPVLVTPTPDVIYPSKEVMPETQGVAPWTARIGRLYTPTQELSLPDGQAETPDTYLLPLILSPNYFDVYNFTAAQSSAIYDNLTEDANNHGTFYGTSFTGGSAGYGYIFKWIPTVSATPTIVYNFPSKNNSSFLPSEPYSRLIQAKDGKFYGTSKYGGSNGYGTIYQYTAGASTPITIYSIYSATTDYGEYPLGALVEDRTDTASSLIFYGTTNSGISNGANGTIFKYTYSGTVGTAGYKLLSNCNTATNYGSSPYGALCQSSLNASYLYGTCSAGGNGYGDIYRISTNGATFTDMAYFSGGTNGTGTTPYVGLVEDKNQPDNFYGTCEAGAGGSGSWYDVAFSGPNAQGSSAYLYYFPLSTTTSKNPYSTINQDLDGNFYGTSYNGGTGNNGTIFRFGSVFPVGSPMYSTYNLVYDFGTAPTNGNSPKSGLVQSLLNDNFYGATLLGGTNSSGVLYELTAPPVTSNSSVTAYENVTTSVPLTYLEPQGTSMLTSATIVTQAVHGTATITVSGGIATCTYQSVVPYAGTDSFQYTVTDNSGTSNVATVSVTVTAVDQQPTFTPGANQAVAENAGMQTVPTWATNVNAGNGDTTYYIPAYGGPTSGNTLTFNVTNNNNALFSTQPAITVSGTSGNLTYIPATNAYGTATVTVILMDSGSTTPYGSNTSTIFTFTITVTQTLTSIVVTPASVPILGTTTLTAKAYDQGGNLMVPQPSFTWTLPSGGGSLTSGGSYTAPNTPGTATAKATSGGVSSPTTSPDITITDATPTLSAITLGTVTTTTAVFKVTGSYTGTGNLTYTLSASGPAAVTFSPQGGQASPGTQVSSTATFTKAGVYTISVVATDASGTSSAPATYSYTVGQTLTSIVINPATAQSVSIGGTLSFTASAKDQFGDPVSPQPTFTWTSTNSGGAASSISGGNFSAGANTGTASVSASASSVTSPATAVTIGDSPVTVATAASAVVNADNKSATLSALGAWAGGESRLTYTWAVVGAQPGTVTFGAANGTNAGKSLVATFSAAGTYFLQVKIADPYGASVVSPPTASPLAVTINQVVTGIVIAPSSATIGIGASLQLAVTSSTDQFGNPMSTTPTPLTWHVTSGSGSIDTTGNYTASGSPGTATVTASYGSVVSNTVTITVTDSAPTLGNITVNPNPVTGTTTALSVTGNYPGSGNLTYSWTTTATPPGGSASFSGGTTGAPYAAVTTTATFTAAGSYTVQVIAQSTSGLNSAPKTVTFTVNATYSSVTASPNPATLNIGDTQTFTATAYDQFQTALTTQPTFTWTLVSGVGSITAAGVYSAGSTPGSAVVKGSATIGSLTYSDTASITVNDVAPTLDPLTLAPNPVTGTTGTFQATGHYPGAGPLTYAYTATGPGAISYSGATTGAPGATITDVATFHKAGTYTVTATVSSPQGKASAPQSITFTVKQTETTIVITPNPASVPLNGTVTLTAKSYDQFGVTLVTQPSFTWSLVSGGAYGSITPGGVFTATGTPGTANISVTGSSVTAPGTVQVINQPPTVATAASANPNPVTTGTTTSLSVLGAYVGTGGEPSLTYTWSALSTPPGGSVTFSANGTNASKNSVATFTSPGNYVLRVTIVDHASGTTSSDVTVTVKETLTSIVVTPGPTDTETISGTGTQTYTAVGLNQFGSTLATQPTFTWSNTGVGSVNSGTGVFTIGTTPGTATITATSGSVSGQTVVTVNDVAPTVGTPASATPNPTTGTTTNLTVLGQYIGGESNLTYTWSVTGPGSVTFSDNGDNAAKNVIATFTATGTYNFTVTIADAFGGSVTSTTSVVVKATHALITVTPNPATLAINGTQTFTATTTDQFGATLSSQVYSWSIPSGVGTIVNNNDGTATYSAGSTPGTATVQVTNHEATTNVPVTVTDIAPTVGTITVNPNPVTSTTAALSVTGSYTGSGTLSYAWSTVGTPPAPVSFSPSSQSAAPGTAVSTTATFTKAGSYTVQVTVTDAAGTQVVQTVTFTVSQTLKTATIAPTPVTVPIGGTQQFTVGAFDQFGDPLASPPTFTYTVTGGSGSVSSSGLYTAPTTPGTATVKAASGSVTASAAITIADVAPTVATAASATPNPVTGTTTTLSVLGAYAGGESNLTYTWAVTGGNGVTYSGATNGTNAAKTITATFNHADTYYFTVTVTDPSGGSTTSTVTVVVNQTATAVTVTPGSATIGIGGTQQFSAAATDQFGNALSTTPTFTWSVPSGLGTIDSTGDYTAGSTPGTATVRAALGSITGTATVTINDVAPTITAQATATPNPVTGTTTSLSILASYPGGESNLVYTWSTTGTPPAPVSFPGNGTNNANTLIASFTKTGTYTIICKVATPSGLSVTSNTLTVVVNATLTTIKVTPNPVTLSVGGSQTFTAQGLDQFGTPLGTQPTVTWSVGSGGVGTITSGGVYSAGTSPGSATVTAVSGSVTGTATVTVKDASPTVATAASATPNPVTGTTTTLSVLGAYAGGESNLTYTWSLQGTPPAAVSYSDNGDNAAKSITTTFFKAGTYQFLVTITDPYGATVTSSVSVTVQQTLTAVSVTPSTPSIGISSTQQFTVVTSDQFGASLTSPPTFTWTVTSGGGSVSSSGLYTAPTSPGTATVKATSGSLSGTATVTIGDVAPTVATSASATPNPVTGTTTTLSVLGAYAGGESNLTYTWSLQGTPPAAVSYSVNNTNAAKSTTATFTAPGTYQFLVTITNPSKQSVTSAVTVTVNSTVTITVSPNPATVAVGLTQQFTATASNQFGTLSPQPTFTWTATGGTITGSGLYTAGNTAGTYMVKATVGSASGTATVNVIAAGTLNGTVSTSSAGANLTTEGTLDWNHWGRGVPGLDQKSGGNLITGYTPVGSSTIGFYRTDKRPLSWTNGSPTASSTNNLSGVYSTGQGTGFQIKAPAVGTTRTFVVYVGGNGAGGTLTATLSDGSVATYTNTQPTQTGVWDAEYTFTFSTITAGTTLNVTWVQSTPGNGSVTLSAATLH